MRILYFSRDYTPHDHRFLAALTKRHEVHFLQLERRGHATEDRPLPPEVERVPWAGGRSPVSFSDGPQLWADLRRVGRSINPDVVQAGPVQRSAFLAALAGLSPLVTMSWGYDLLVDAQKNRWWEWATRFTLKRSAALLGDCDTIRRLAISYGMRSDRIVTFPWGVDIHHFTPLSSSHLHPQLSGTSALAEGVQMGRERGAFTLLSTRSWEPIYGVDIIAQAFVQAARRCPELRLVMLGNGSLAGEVRRIFAQGGVEERVTFPGQVSFDDLPRYYRLADLYVSASHSDGSSISLLEAMACGTPVLVSDIPGNREWVTPSVIARGDQALMSKSVGDDGYKEGEAQVGWLFPDGDVNALAQAILRAVEQREHLPHLGRAARNVAERRADWEKNFQEMEKVYAMVR